MARAAQLLFCAVTALSWLVSACVAHEGRGEMPGLLGDFTCGSVAFYKTHKTASSTISLVLDRLGATKNARFLHLKTEVVFHTTEDENLPDRVDFYTTHVNAPFTKVQQQLWPQVMENPGYLTILREPVSRIISHHLYFHSWKEKTNLSLQRYGKLLGHMQISELMDFGPGPVAPQLDDFLRSSLFNQTTFLLTEYLAEGLAAMRLHCGWSYRDLAFGHAHCAGCWDTKLTTKIIHRPTPQDLNMTEETLEILKQRTRDDKTLYDAALKKWEGVRQRGGSLLDETTKELLRRNDVVNEYCQVTVKTAADFTKYPGCLWLVLHPIEFYSLLGPDNRVNPSASFKPHTEHRGFPKGTVTAGEMMEGFRQMYDRLFAGLEE